MTSDEKTQKSRIYLITPPLIDIKTFPDKLNSAMQGGDIDKSLPINVSNVALVVKKKSGRVGYKFDKNG